MTRYSQDNSVGPRECPKCHGEGTLLGPLGFEIICPVCDGDGIIWEDPEYVLAEDEEWY